jgi:hypothetical protein
MPDQKPPKLIGTERATLLALLSFQRESFVRKVTGVTDEVARQSPVTSGTSLLWLTRHVAMAEALWIARRFAGNEIVLFDGELRPDDTIDEAITDYRSTWALVDPIVATASLDDLCGDMGNDEPVNLRWVLMHLLEEIARHAGHADIIRELADGRTGR